MSDGRGLPYLPLNVNKKAVPPGSHLYKQVLDDLRYNASSSLSLAPSFSSSTTVSPLQSSRNEFHDNTARRESIDNSVGHSLDSWEFYARATCDVGRNVNGGDWLRPCRACSAGGGNLLSYSEERGQDGTRREEEEEGGKGNPARGCVGGTECCGSCVHVCDFLADLQIEDVVQTTNTSTITITTTPTPDEMGHSPSLLHHRHHKRDYIARDETPSPHHSSSHHHHHPRDPSSPKKKPCGAAVTNHHHKDKAKSVPSSGIQHDAPDFNSPTQFSRSPTPSSQRGHVISWSASSGVQQARPTSLLGVPTGEEVPDDAAGSSPGRAHSPISRLFARAPQRQNSPSPNRAGGGADPPRGRPHSSPPRGGGGGRGGPQQSLGEDGVEGAGRRRRDSAGKSPTTRSPKKKLFPDLHRTRSRGHPQHHHHLLSPQSPAIFQRRGSHEIPRGRHETWGSAASGTPTSLPPAARTATPSPVPPATKEHIRLCAFDADDDDDMSPNDSHQFPEITDLFRLRSQSDVSMHMQRGGQLTRLPLLRQRSRLREEEDEEEEEGEEEEEEESQVHVHWADEHWGSPLATSVLLNSIRPRALSHGSATLPRKPILKKPLGF